ncbi:MAG: hypothetical protein ACLU4N_23675 [Butyricimonas faecihominis]
MPPEREWLECKLVEDFGHFEKEENDNKEEEMRKIKGKCWMIKLELPGVTVIIKEPLLVWFGY